MTSTQRLSLSHALDNGHSGKDTAFCVLSSSCGVSHWQLGTCHVKLSFSWDGLVHELLDVVFFGAQHKKCSPKATDPRSGLSLLAGELGLDVPGCHQITFSFLLVCGWVFSGSHCE